MALDQALSRLEIQTKGSGFNRIDGSLNNWIRSTQMQCGVVHLTCLHTSCRLLVKLT